MKAVHKFQLHAGKEPTRLTLREGFRILRCEYLVSQKSVFLWVEQPLNISTPKLERNYVVVMSGEPIPMSYRHVDTALDPFGPEAYHVFEVPVEQGQRFRPVQSNAAVAEQPPEYLPLRAS